MEHVELDIFFCLPNFIYRVLKGLFRRAYIMHTINLVEKAYILYVDSETTLGTTVLENIVTRNAKKHNHDKVSYNCLESTTQADHNSRRSLYSHVLFILFTFLYYVFFYFHFKKEKSNKR